jgi:hypothetical protein
MAGEFFPGENFMPHYRQRLNYWKNYLDNAGHEQLGTSANNAIGELDGLWTHRGLMNKEFYAKGDCMWT